MDGVTRDRGGRCVGTVCLREVVGDDLSRGGGVKLGWRVDWPLAVSMHVVLPKSIGNYPYNIHTGDLLFSSSLEQVYLRTCSEHTLLSKWGGKCMFCEAN